MDEHEQVTFEHYLGLLPPDIVFKTFFSHRGQSRKILSSSRIRDIARLASAEKSLADRFNRLTPEAKFFCSLVYLYGKRGFPAHRIKGFDDELLSSFLVYAGMDETGRTGYFGFDEFEHRLLPLVAAKLREKTKTDVKKPASPFIRWQCLSDVAVLEVLASHDMLAKTKKGVFSKLSESVLKKFLHAYRESFFRGEEAGAVGGFITTVLFDYALSRGLLFVEGEMFRPSAGHILAWLKTPLQGRYSDFCGFAFEQAPLWSRPVLDALFETPEKIWLSTHYFPESHTKEVHGVASLLHYCGILDMQRSGGHVVFSKIQETMRQGQEMHGSAKAITVLSDFSAVLGQEIEPKELYRFSKVGGLQSFDKVYKGTITREIVHDSLSEGFHETQLVGWLNKWQAPDNVVQTVKEWIREFSRIYFTTDAAVFSFDEKATRQILSYQPLQRLVEPVRSHCVFRIRKGHEAEARRVLVEMGFDPRAPVEIQDRPAQQEPALEAGVRRIMPLVRFEEEGPAISRAITEGKYSQRLKALDISDMFHVFDYAILMGHAVSLEYAGGPYVRKGLYKIIPHGVHREAEPSVEGAVLPKGVKKKFLLKNIIKIGVGPA